MPRLDRLLIENAKLRTKVDDQATEIGRQWTVIRALEKKIDTLERELAEAAPGGPTEARLRLVTTTEDQK